MGKRELKNILNNGKTIEVDLNSKLVFISDIHRGDGGSADSLIGNKNIYLAALRYYYREEYTLIEVGDGDELWKNKNCVDIAYNYRDVFSIYNKFNNNDRLYMIYGNHDKMKKTKDFKNFHERKFKRFGENFGEEFLNLINNLEFYNGLVLKFNPSNKKGIVIHGHQLDFMNDELSKFTRFLVRYFWRFLEGVAGFKAPNSPANNYKKGNKIDEKLDRFAKENKILLIAGHTHRARFPKVNEGIYFNDGSCVLPYSITSLEINKGLISLVKWSIEVSKENNLCIRRSFLAGPEKIEAYLKFVDD